MTCEELCGRSKLIRIENIGKNELTCAVDQLQIVVDKGWTAHLLEFVLNMENFVFEPVEKVGLKLGS
jgi:hypothetical protein